MIELPWSEFKSQCLDKQWQYIVFDCFNTYWVYASRGDFKVQCKIAKSETPSDDQTDFEDNYKDNATTDFSVETRGRFEREDIRDQMSCDAAEFDENGVAEVSMEMPSGGRFIGGGYAILDHFGFGDKLENVSVVDVNNILGFGEEFTVATYHDSEVALENQGWYVWAAEGGTAEVEVEPMGYYGFIPEGLFLELYFKKTAESTATKVLVDYWMGKKTS